MWEQGEWDQEDMYGANHCYRAWEPQDTTNTMNYLVIGPWFHSQINRQGRAIGPFVWATDTARAMAARRAAAVLQSIPQAGFAESRHSAGVDL